MRILIDTHVAIWFWNTDARMTPRLLQALTDPENEIIFSQVSTWEIALKYEKGRIRLPSAPETFIPDAVTKSGFHYQPIQDRWIYFSGKLPAIHKDPFDRLLVAHALIEGHTLATDDTLLLQYPVPLLTP